VSGRRAGLNLPLFSAPSSSSWGIGEIADLVPLSSWLQRAGISRLLLLPIGTVREGETSPYAATSTMAIDPVYIAMNDLADFTRTGGINALSDDGKAALERARSAPAVDYASVRRAKQEALGLAFACFQSEEWEQLTTRAASLAGYIARERYWLDDYALFQALKRSLNGLPWREWPAALRDRDAHALDEARRQLALEVLEHQYGQWIAERQWQAARTAVAERHVGLVGDLPFVPHMESPEVWARAGEFMLDVSAGVPPDAFSATGQDWGLPTYKWSAIAESGYAWIHQRARRMAALYDGLRVDHVIGVYRTYGRPPHGEPFFNPADEAAQRAQGEIVIDILRQAGIDVIAEDLGVVPDFLRESLKAIGAPGCKVIRWERDWHTTGQPFLNPASYPLVSAAMTGTHDTEPMSEWWRTLAAEDRAAFLTLPLFRERAVVDAERLWSDELRDLVIELTFRAGSRDVFLPVQDVFGWADRINKPGTVNDGNWTWRLPWPVDQLESLDLARERADALRRFAVATGRSPASDYTKGSP
jgi:4-alpha-glucanotransferase